MLPMSSTRTIERGTSSAARHEVNGEKRQDHRPGDRQPDPQPLAAPVHQPAEHGELHRDEVLALVLVPEERLPELDRAALEHVDDAEEHDPRAGAPTDRAVRPRRQCAAITAPTTALLK